jgi:hypothetical protein
MPDNNICDKIQFDAWKKMKDAICHMSGVWCMIIVVHDDEMNDERWKMNDEIFYDQWFILIVVISSTKKISHVLQ